jgi:hypothetical protein
LSAVNKVIQKLSDYFKVDMSGRKAEIKAFVKEGMANVSWVKRMFLSVCLLRNFYDIYIYHINIFLLRPTKQRLQRSSTPATYSQPSSVGT